MAKVEHLIKASPERVFAVLADGWTYSDWVVGTAHIRDVEDHWPAVGAKLFHKAGPWPLSLRDASVVLESAPPHHLKLKVKLWPLGAGQVRFELTAVDEGMTRVTMYEDFVEGPLRWVRNKINDLLLHRRNRESLRRLADLAARRTPRPSDAR